MRIDTVETKVYPFEELCNPAQQSALYNLRNINVDHEDWADFIIEDAKTCAKILGIDIDHIYWSGFWSQGDGAQFTGQYAYAKQSTKRIREYAPKDVALHDIADKLLSVQREYGYRLSAIVTSNGRHHHEYCTDIEVSYDKFDWLSGEVIACELRNFMRWIYRQLVAEYEYMTNDECIRETIIANDYEFTSEGVLY